MSASATGAVVGMLAVVCVWGTAVATFTGLGYAFLRWSRLESSGAGGLFAAGWIGWALTVGGLQIWHLFRPVDFWARGLLVALGLAGWAWNRRVLAAQMRHAARRALPFGAIAAPLVLWMANRATAPELPYDAGLYHLSTIRWLRAYPIVPGLGNLHTRLAYNISYFLYMAALDVEPWLHRAQHVGAYLLLLALALWIAWTGYSLIRRDLPLDGLALFRIVLIPAVGNMMWNGGGIGEPDMAVWILGIVLLDGLGQGIVEGLAGSRAATNLALVLLVASAAATVKLSAAPLGVATSVAVTAAAVWLAPRSPSVHAKLAFPARILIPPAVLVGAWVLRGFLLSGYPAFPSTLGGIGVDWRVPEDAVRAEARWIMSWARNPGLPPDDVLGGWGWIGTWIRGTWKDGAFAVVTPLVVCGLSMGVAVSRRRPWRKDDRWLALAPIPPVIGLLVWFTTAPDVRFAGSAFWLLAACSVLLAAERWELRQSRTFTVALLLTAVVVAGAMQLGERVAIPPGPHWGFYPLPEENLVEEKMASGLVVVRPAVGDQCWFAPLMCTPGPLPGLSLRVPGDLRRGFRSVTSSAGS